MRGKEISPVKEVWGGPVGGSVTWELERKVKGLYHEMFLSGNFQGQKSFLVVESCNTSYYNYLFLIELILIYFIHLCDICNLLS